LRNVFFLTCLGRSKLLHSSIENWSDATIAGSLFVDHKSTDQWLAHWTTRSGRHSDVSHWTGVISKKFGWKNNIDRRLLLVQGKLIILSTYYYIKRFNYIFYTRIYIYLHTAKRSFNHSKRLNTSANLRDLTYNMFLYWWLFYKYF